MVFVIGISFYLKIKCSSCTKKTLISTADAQTQRECYPHPMFSVLLLIIERKVSKNNKMLIANKILSAAKHRRSLSN